MKTFIPLLLFSAVIISCKEQTPDIITPSAFDETKINGVVLDKTTDEPVAGATVYHVVETGWSNYTILETLTSDSDGVFNLINYDEPGENYYVLVEKNLYFESGYVSAAYPLNTGLDMDVEIKPMAWLQTHFKNVPPSEPSDYVWINGYAVDSFHGDNIDTIVNYEVFGNFDATFYWEALEGFGVNDTVYCTAFDTSYYEILY